MSMQHFTGLNDLHNLKQTITDAIALKENPWSHQHLGKHKTLLLLFYNSSLRTHLSTHIAAERLGLSVITKNMSTAWNVEFEEGVTMDADKAEHIKEAAMVTSCYTDIIGIRAFPSLINMEEDYKEKIISGFKKYSSAPILNLESASRHPLQALADMMTIETYKPKPRPKVVLTWAPHPKVLPQAVANSFAAFSNAMDYDVHICNPVGYDLAKQFKGKATQHHEQEEAFKNADFIYAKNWSSTSAYGTNPISNKEWQINTSKMNLSNDAKFMHCLPIRRNVVASDDVLDHKNCLIKEQAENRLFATQSILKNLLQNNGAL